MVNLRSAAAATRTTPCSAAIIGCTQSAHAMAARRVIQILLNALPTRRVLMQLFGSNQGGLLRSLAINRSARFGTVVTSAALSGRRVRFQRVSSQLLRQYLGGFV